MTDSLERSFPDQLAKQIDLAPLDQTSCQWDKRDDEPIAAYTHFLAYLELGPDRSVSQAARLYAQRQGLLLPGEPVGTEIVYQWNREYLRHQWSRRAKLWDQQNLYEYTINFEAARRQAISEMVEEHVEGWKLIQSAAIQSLFKRNENGQIILDDAGQPMLKEVEDPVQAAKMFKLAVQGKRVEFGLPKEYLAMRGPELIQRIQEAQEQLRDLNDVIDAEVNELTNETLLLDTDEDDDDASDED